MVNYTIVSGSHRPNAQTLKVSSFIQDRIAELDADSNSELISLSDNPLPLFDEGFWSKEPRWQEVWNPISEKLQKADALVICAPEWGGMVPAALKNFFLLASNLELGHKPALPVAVTAGVAGAYPIAELRMSSYKNCHLCYIPENMIVRHAEGVLNGKESASKDDEITRKRLDYSLSILREYAKALRSVRDSGVVNHKDFPFGM